MTISTTTFNLYKGNKVIMSITMIIVVWIGLTGLATMAAEGSLDRTIDHHSLLKPNSTKSRSDHHFNLFRKLANWHVPQSSVDPRKTNSSNVTSDLRTTTGATFNHSTTFKPDLNAVCWPGDKSPNVDNLYRMQRQQTQFYHNLCGNRFIKLFRLNQTFPSTVDESSKDILLFGSVCQSNCVQLQLNLIHQLSGTVQTTFDYLVVIRVDFGKFDPENSDVDLNGITNNNLTVVVDRVSYQIHQSSGEIHRPGRGNNLTAEHFKLAHKVVDFLVPQYFSHKHVPEIVVSNRSNLNLIADSYVMVCLRYQSTLSSSRTSGKFLATLSSLTSLSSPPSPLRCWPQIAGNKISCYCTDDSQRGFIYVCVALSISLMTIIGLVVYTACTKTIQEPEVQFNLILCMPGHSSHEYLVIFRVGPSSESFNYDTSYIDFQLLGPQDEQIGIPVRFSCKYLHDHLYGEMHMFVGRISPIPMVHGIMANHSHANNLIFFYDFSVIDLHDNNDLVQEESINQYILNEPRVFRPQTSIDIDDQNNMLGQRRRLQNLMANRLNELEFIAIIAFVLGFIACMVMVLCRYYQFFSNWHNSHQTWIQLIICLFLISFLSWFLIFIIELLYKYVIKSNYIDESYKQLITDSTGNGHKILWVIWILLLYLCGLLFCIGTVILSLQVEFLAIFWWSGVVAVISALVFGLWLCVELYSMFKTLFSCCNEMVTQDGFERSCSEDNLNNHPSSSSNSMFTQLSKQHKTISSINCMFEPKMVNPNFPSVRSSNGSSGALVANTTGSSGNMSASIVATIGGKTRNKANRMKRSNVSVGSKKSTATTTNQLQQQSSSKQVIRVRSSKELVPSAASSSSSNLIPTGSAGSNETLLQAQQQQSQKSQPQLLTGKRSKTKFKQSNPNLVGGGAILLDSSSSASSIPAPSLSSVNANFGGPKGGGPPNANNNTNTFKNLLNKIVMNSKKAGGNGGTNVGTTGDNRKREASPSLQN